VTASRMHASAESPTALDRDRNHGGPLGGVGQHPSVGSSSVDWSTELDDPAVQREFRSALTLALLELPDHYRAVTILHDVEGKDPGPPGPPLSAPASRRLHVRRNVRRRDGLLRSIDSAPAAAVMAERRRRMGRVSSRRRTIQQPRSSRPPTMGA
jgi:hypothetical protein